MADVLRIKRRVSGSPGAPVSLANAELAYNEVDHILYYGEGTGGAGGTASVISPIAGQGMATNTAPVMNSGTVGVAGSSSFWAKNDHIHPSDTSRASSANPTFTGTTTVANLTATGTVSGTGFTNLRQDQFSPPNVDVPWGSRKITSLADPTNPQDAATKNYVDLTIQGLDTKLPCRLATTVNLAALTGLLTIDGVVTIAGDRVLVKDQTAQAANGIYVVAAGAWARAADTDTWTELVAAFTFVSAGTANADNGYVCTVDAGGTLGTTAVVWAQFSGAGQVIAGEGLTKTGNQLDIVGTAGRIDVNADNVDIDAAYVGQTSITTLGTIATGTWNATTLVVGKGGTGATTLTGYLKGAGTVAITASATIPNTDISGLGTMAIQNAATVAITGGTIDNVTFDMGTF